MNRRPWRSLELLVLFVLALSCSKHSLVPDHHDGGVDRVIVAGSTAILPLLTDAANDFMRSHPRIAVEVQGGGSQQGVTRTLQGEVTVGASDVGADTSIASRLEDHKVAMSGFAAMANRGIFNEQIQSLSLEQLKNIFTGQLDDWFDVGGRHQHITVINRRKGSGTRVAFGQAVLGSDDFVAGPEQDSSALVLTSLEQTEGAVSYLALAYRRDSLKVFAVAGVAATNANVVNGSYPIWSYEHLYTLGPAAGAAKTFINYLLSYEVQTNLVQRNGFAPLGADR
jgi:phosphate transport system substrate-binding protein